MSERSCRKRAARPGLRHVTRHRCSRGSGPGAHEARASSPHHDPLSETLTRPPSHDRIELPNGRRPATPALQTTKRGSASQEVSKERKLLRDTGGSRAATPAPAPPESSTCADGDRDLREGTQGHTAGQRKGGVKSGPTVYWSNEPSSL